MTLTATGPVIMLTLGDFQFGISTAAYQELTRAAEYRWAALDRFGQHSALQFTGPGADTVSLDGVVYPEFRGGTGQLDAMRALAAKGEPQMLIDGSGRLLGKWAVLRVSERASVFAAAGVPRRQEFTMELRFFGEATAEEAAAVAQARAAAPAAAASGPFGSAREAATAITTAGSSIGSRVSSAADALSSAMSAVSNAAAAATSALAKANSAVASAQRLIGAAQALQSAGTQLTAANGLQGVLSAASRLVGAASGASYAAAELAGSDPAFEAVQTSAARLANEATRASSQASALLQRIDPWPGM